MSYKAVPHLEHADCLEVAIYRKDHPFDKEPISSITVECTKCGEVVEEVYNASEDNTSPLDCEFPESDRRTWEEGVQDAVRIVQNEMCNKKALHHPPQTSVHPAVFATLNEVELHLAAMLSRGSYESHDTVMQQALPSREDLFNTLEANSMKDPWKQNETQFARLLCEIVATSPVGQNPDIHALAESMDLAPSDVRELFDRAEQVWEKAKEGVK